MRDRKTGERFNVQISGWIDAVTFRQVFYQEEYNLEALPQFDNVTARYRQILSDGKTPVIFDLGANIGLASLFWSVVFPEAKIYGFEIDLENTEKAKRNLDCKPRCEIVHCGVSRTSGRGRITDPSDDNNAYTLRIDPDGDFDVATMAELVEKYTGSSDTELLIVKMDIEGGEADSFEKSQWLDEVTLLVVELHDWMFPGEARSRRALQAMAARNRDFVLYKSNVASFQNRNG